eukprot:9932113-Alexandrium_andersonii.AAC.1
MAHGAAEGPRAGAEGQKASRGLRTARGHAARGGAGEARGQRNKKRTSAARVHTHTHTFPQDSGPTSYLGSHCVRGTRASMHNGCTE